MEATYSYTPKVRMPGRTVLIITIVTLGIGLLWYYNTQEIITENEDK